MIKFSIYAWFGFWTLPVVERFHLIKTAGFDGVLLWWGDEHFQSKGQQVEQLELAQREGLFVENIHTPFLDVNNLWLDNAAGDQYEKTLAQCIVDCGQYQIPTAVVHVTHSNTAPPPGPVGLDRLKRLVELAERQQVNLALENLRLPQYLDYIFANLQAERLGFCYDSGHAHCYSPDRDLLDDYGTKLKALHLHDNDGQADRHQIPGTGTINWRALKAKLNRIGYSGAVALETLAAKASDDHAAETPEQYLKKAFTAVQGLFGETL